MANPRFNGTLPALITPFDEQGEVDVPKLEAFVKWLLPQVHGFYACGSYGSQPMMRNDQCKLVMETVMKCCDGAKNVKGEKTSGRFEFTMGQFF